MPRTLYVELGPVQTFIAQARRTRDLWAGSFLLSWLSGVAMRAVSDPAIGGTIVYPVVDNDPLYKALGGEPPVGPKAAWPAIGTLPNRFKATAPDGADPKAMVEVVHDRWAKLAEAVWSVFLADIRVENRVETRRIWDRQVNAFWRVAWAFEDGTGTNPLDRRKHWRTAVLPPDEGGDHCSIMGDLQELSGHVRARGGGKAQDEFWDVVHDRAKHEVYKRDTVKGTLELRRSERLCAIALIKRLFPLLPLEALKDTIGWIPDKPVDWPDTGVDEEKDKELRDQIRKLPSTATMAATPWMLHAHRAEPTRCKGYAGMIERIWPDAAPGILTRAERFSAVKGLAGTPFGHIDGNLLFADGIARRRAEMRPNRSAAEAGAEDGEAENVRSLTSALRTLQAAVAPTGGRRRQRMREAAPFYALLRMDGDRIGERVAKDPEGASRRLERFTEGVRDTVRDAHGLLIYAGGDDVLALLPLHTALDTAATLADRFRAAFDGTATMSAAVVFAHVTHPLRDVLETARGTLEDVAKERNGRDSVAVTVSKRGGTAATWVSAWAKTDGKPAAPELCDLAKRFSDDDERSSSFLFHVSERYGDLLKGFDDAQLDDLLVDLLLAERLKGRDLTGNQAAHSAARKEMEELAAVCRPRHAGTGERRFDPDGALVVKFLAENGIWMNAEETS